MAAAKKPKTKRPPGKKSIPAKAAANPVGRPTGYRPEYCAAVIGWGKQGKSLVWIATELGVVKQTVLNWASAHPEFLDALTLAKQHSQRWWEDAGQNGMTKANFSASAWSRSMAARFPDDWREISHQRIGDPNGKPLQNPAPALIQPVLNITLKK